MDFENLLIITDIVTEKDYGFYYRVASIDEWLKYGRERVRITRSQGDDEQKTEGLLRLNIESGALAVEGIREGDFPFSSDENSPLFDAAWRDKLKAKFYYLLPSLVDYAYRGGAVSEKN